MREKTHYNRFAPRARRMVHVRRRCTSAEGGLHLILIKDLLCGETTATPMTLHSTFAVGVGRIRDALMRSMRARKILGSAPYRELSKAYLLSRGALCLLHRR